MTDEQKNQPTDETVSDEQITDIVLLQQKANEYLDGWKRAKADYLNFKKEQEKRSIEMIQYANAALLAGLLPIYNHYKLALKHIPADDKQKEWVKGFEHIYKQLLDFFKQLGIEEIKTVGEKFNPEFHEALGHEAVEGFAPEIIYEEVAPGYTLHGKVLQAAKVKIAK